MGLHDGTAIASEDLMRNSPGTLQQVINSPDAALGHQLDKPAIQHDWSKVVAALPQSRSYP